MVAKVILLASTQLRNAGVSTLLQSVGSTQFQLDEGLSGSEGLVELAGRLCYKSFEPGLNANVTKVREGNADYINNILKSRHGSVLEHGTVTFAFIGCSRIFTHELVRHRAGTAYSQESMRYVRMDNIGMYLPDVFEADYLAEHNVGLYGPDKVAYEVQSRFNAAVQYCERMIAEITHILDMDKLPFAVKKMLTSAIRRIAPSGHTTNIIVTANHRAWRHMIEQRTDVHAEEEIRKVFNDVAQQLADDSPAIYRDMLIDTGGIVRFGNSKI